MIKKLLCVLLFVCLLCLSTCNMVDVEDISAPQESIAPLKSSPVDRYSPILLQAAQVCRDIYETAEHSDSANVVLSDDTIEQMVDAVASLGHSVIDEDGTLDMRNPQALMEFGTALTSGEASECSYFTVYRDGHIGICAIGTDYTLFSASATFIDEVPEIYLACSDDLTDIQYTDKGWLIYERDQAGEGNPKQFNIDSHTMVRIAALPQEYRHLCETYITPVGYSENNLFTTSWTESNYSEIDFSSLYAMLFGMTHDGENLTWYTAKSYYQQPTGSALYLIPQAEFEATVQTFLNVSTATLRSIPEYSANDQGYWFLGWQAGYYNVVPRIPTPEVVDAVYNADGTITLTVDALFSWYGTDRAFTHEVTLRPCTEGTFQYVGNRVISKDNIFPEQELPSHRSSAIRQLQS